MRCVVGGHDHARARRLRAARCATRTTIGSPAMSASGLSGRRVDASRAGIRTVKLIALTARRGVASAGAGRRRVERARFALEHHRDAVADREGQAVGVADQLARRLAAACARRFSGPLQSGQTSSSSRRWSMRHAGGQRRRRQPVRRARRRTPASSSKSSGATQTRVLPDAPGRSLTASFSVTITSPACRAARAASSKSWWSGSGSRLDRQSPCRAASRRSAPAARCRRTAITRPAAQRSSAAALAASPRHQAASGHHAARADAAPGSRAAACSARSAL